MEATRAQREAIRKVTRAANRRIERAREKAPGQADWLEYLVEKLTDGSKKFSAASAGLTYEQAAAKIEALNKFMSYKTSTRKGWEDTKQRSVENANIKLQQKKTAKDSLQIYDLTDKELADALELADAKTTKDFYTVANKVQAAKIKAGKKWKGSEAQLSKAIAAQPDYPDEVAEVLADNYEEQYFFEEVLKLRRAAKSEK